MNTEKLFGLMSAIHPLSEQFKEALKNELIVLSLPKNFVLLEAPKVSEHAYFLNTGFALSYYYADGRKQIEKFWKPGELIISPISFFEQVPSEEFIQLIAPGEVLYISHESALRLTSGFPEANLISKVIMNRYYLQDRDRLRGMQHLSAVERYDKVLNDFNGIEQIIPQEQIASYLGIAPQSLSRIKRRRRPLKV